MEQQDKKRNLGPWLSVAFVGAVAVAVGIYVLSQRLSDESLAVLAGSVCGVAAAIPTSLLIVAVSRRRDSSSSKPQQPPMMVVPPQYVQPQMIQPPSIDRWPVEMRQRGSRAFDVTVMGGNDDQIA